ncbi:MAG: YceI family protein [Burkholderiales bacterium]
MRKILERPQTRASLIAAGVLVIALAALVAYVLRPSTAAPTSGSSAQPTLSATNGTVYTIDASSSEASFTIHEVLFGAPNTVVGKTSDVSGQIAVDQQDPSKSQVGQIRVNLTSLVTDNNLRNHSIQNYILETDSSGNQYATFATRAITGWPTSITLGQAVTLQLTGDLTVHGQTHSVTFPAQVTLKDASTLVGQAQTAIRYADYGISIPNVPSVTRVDSTVQLAISFTALAMNS